MSAGPVTATAMFPADDRASDQAPQPGRARDQSSRVSTLPGVMPVKRGRPRAGAMTAEEVAKDQLLVGIAYAYSVILHRHSNEFCRPIGAPDINRGCGPDGDLTRLWSVLVCVAYQIGDHLNQSFPVTP